MEQTDFILLWGSNARETHPVMFLHMLKGINNGARMVVVDPRRTLSVEAAHDWLPVRVGADIALANAMGHVIIEENLQHEWFISHATTGFADYKQAVERYTPEYAETVTGIPAEKIREVARDFARAPTGMICLPGFQAVENDDLRAKFERAWGVTIPPKRGWHQSAMMDAMERGELRGLYVLGENPLASDADAQHAERLLRGLDFLVVQDIFEHATTDLADVVLPGTASWAEADGTVTSSERRVQLCRKAVDPPGDARNDWQILQDLANRMGAHWNYTSSEQIWDELRSLSPIHAGMSYKRLEELHGLQWPCYDETHPGERSMHWRLWRDPLLGARTPFIPTEYEQPVDPVDSTYPIVLTTGRRLEFYNSGVQSGLYDSARPQEEFIEVNPQDAAERGIEEGALVRVSSRRGSVDVRAHINHGLYRGLAFMSFHFPDTAMTNVLTVHAIDPRSGTAEFKASAINIEPVHTGAAPLPSVADVTAAPGASHEPQAQ
jgi:formate dehydrogenase major subunit